MKALQDDSAEELARIAPVLDAAINQLGEKDRAAILLRFFEKLDFRSVGEALGTNEDTAQKRVSRALEKLHALLRGAGRDAFGDGARHHAWRLRQLRLRLPGMAASFAGTALASASLASGGALVGSKILGLVSLKPAVIAALAVGALAVPLLIQNGAMEKLRQENVSLHQQAGGSEQLTAENERLSNLVFQANLAAVSDGAPSK